MTHHTCDLCHLLFTKMDEMAKGKINLVTKWRRASEKCHAFENSDVCIECTSRLLSFLHNVLKK